ncbi:NUDIX hydrolase [bacterium]|jgi:8-oxo-dGTP pyrophosphatase MutT (NUDIX family)|nr:NUDIX hydrolase [bacterium]
MIIASGPVIVEKNKVLLDQHGDTDFWKFCGGRIENNESLIDCAKREAKEEVGIDIKIINPEPFISYTKKDTQDIILVHWLAERVGEIKPGEDIREWQWLDIDNLPENLAPNIIPTLRHFNLMK